MDAWIMDRQARMIRVLNEAPKRRPRIIVYRHDVPGIYVIVVIPFRFRGGGQTTKQPSKSSDCLAKFPGPLERLTFPTRPSAEGCWSPRSKVRHVVRRYFGLGYNNCPRFWPYLRCGAIPSIECLCITPNPSNRWESGTFFS